MKSTERNTAKVRADSLCQVEISVSDTSASADFYNKVFGWARVPAYMQDYLMLDTGSAQIGVALVPGLEGSKAQQMATIYFRVESRACAEEISSASALLSSHRPPKPKTLPGFGKVHFLVDLDGQRWGLFVDEESSSES